MNDIGFKEYLILNNQQHPYSWNRRNIKDENSFGNIVVDSNLSVAALWSPAIAVVVVTPHTYSSAQPKEQFPILCVIPGDEQLCFTDTFPLEMYQP